MRKLILMISLLLLLAAGALTVSATGQRSSAGASQAGENQLFLPAMVGGPVVGLEVIADGFTSPVYLVEAPDGSGRLFVLDQVGQIWIITAEGDVLPTAFLDLADRMVPIDPSYDERGLLGLAFHPDYANNGRFFVYYSAPLRDGAPAGYDHTSHISEFHVSADPNVADPDSEAILLQVDKPQSNHNGGTLLIGPDDGYLYIAIGDGGGADDVGLGHVDDWYAENEGGNGQDVEANLLGDVLRIDVDAGPPYGIPADNPFVGGPGMDETYAYGFRNPYRMSFDLGGSHQLFVGDAGQNLWEEVSIVELGGNYGWNVWEGAHCFSTDDPDTSPPDCPDVVGAGHPDEGAPLLGPIIEFANINNTHVPGIGAVVVGGYVYRGSDLPQFDGDYIFGSWSTNFDTCEGAVFVAQPRNVGLWHMRPLRFQHMTDFNHCVLSFGQDLAGEVYLLTTDNTGPAGNTGIVFKLVQPGQGP
ncbi:MAG: PQQ-dependent sugar dehydrogenase [Candidatus Promineifilaceae bacterium]